LNRVRSAATVRRERARFDAIEERALPCENAEAGVVTDVGFRGDGRPLSASGRGLTSGRATVAERVREVLHEADDAVEADLRTEVHVGVGVFEFVVHLSLS